MHGDTTLFQLTKAMELRMESGIVSEGQRYWLNRWIWRWTINEMRFSIERMSSTELVGTASSQNIIQSSVLLLLSLSIHTVEIGRCLWRLLKTDFLKGHAVVSVLAYGVRVRSWLVRLAAWRQPRRREVVVLRLRQAILIGNSSLDDYELWSSVPCKEWKMCKIKLPYPLQSPDYSHRH